MVGAGRWALCKASELTSKTDYNGKQSIVKVLLVVPTCKAGGHPPIYIKAILRAAKQRQWVVDLAAQGGDLHHEDGIAIKQLVGECAGEILDSQFEAKRVTGRLSWAQAQWQRWKSICRISTEACRHNNYNVVFAMEGDAWLMPAALLGRYRIAAPLSTIMLRIRFHDSEVPNRQRISLRVQRALFRRFLAKSWSGVVCTPEKSLVDKVGGWSARESRKVAFVPDVGQTPRLIPKDEARAHMGWPQHARFVVCAGGINRRKGIENLIAAIAHAQCSKDMGAALIGPVSPELTLFLEGEICSELKRQGRLQVHPGPYTRERLDVALSASDAAWLNYIGHYGSSSFLWEAAQARLPMNGCSDGMIGRDIREYNLGMTTDGARTVDVVAALEKLTTKSTQRDLWCENCDIAGAAHTEERFGQGVCSALEGVAIQREI